MMPTMCDGSRWSRSKPKPVTLVATVVARKSKVPPAMRADLSMPAATTSPLAMPTRLNATWINVNVDIPRIIFVPPVIIPAPILRQKPRRRTVVRLINAIDSG